MATSFDKFTAKWESVLVVIQETANSQKFHFKVNRKSLGTSKKQY